MLGRCPKSDNQDLYGPPLSTELYLHHTLADVIGFTVINMLTPTNVLEQNIGLGHIDNGLSICQRQYCVPILYIAIAQV